MSRRVQAANVATRSQRVNRVVATLQIIATTFVMHAMFGCRSPQLKMPRPDAYAPSARAATPGAPRKKKPPGVSLGGVRAGGVALSLVARTAV